MLFGSDASCILCEQTHLSVFQGFVQVQARRRHFMHSAIYEEKITSEPIHRVIRPAILLTRILLCLEAVY